MTTNSNSWTRLAVAGLFIVGTMTMTGMFSASAKDVEKLQLAGQSVTKLTEVLGEPQGKLPLADGGQLYIYTYEHVLKGGHIMSAQPRGKAMSQDMTHQCRAEFDVSKDGVVRGSGISGSGCPTK